MYAGQMFFNHQMPVGQMFFYQKTFSLPDLELLRPFPDQAEL
jgi:hypothetical protein